MRTPRTRWIALVLALFWSQGAVLTALHVLLEAREEQRFAFDTEASWLCGGCKLPSHHHHPGDQPAHDAATCAICHSANTALAITQLPVWTVAFLAPERFAAPAPHRYQSLTPKPLSRGPPALSCAA